MFFPFITAYLILVNVCFKDRDSSPKQKVEHVPARVGIRPVKLRKAAAPARNCDELFILYIKNFCKVSAGCLKLVAFKFRTSAFCADKLPFLAIIIQIMHLLL